MFSRFVGGKSIQDAARRCKGAAFTPIFDYAREGSKTAGESWDYIHRIEKDLKHFPAAAAIALKSSSFAGNDIHMMYAIKKAVKAGVRTVFLDAESELLRGQEARAYGKALQVFNQSQTVCYKTYQMYRRGAITELLQDMSEHPRLGIKLVRGAYYKQDFPTGSLYKNKGCTDASFDDAINTVVKEIKGGTNHTLVIATHNDRSIDKALCLDPPKDRTAFAQLLGMNDLASQRIIEQGYKVYKYVPYGGLIETYPYLMRRLYENLDVLLHSYR